MAASAGHPSAGHPSAEHIFDQIKAEFPTTSLATVYKTIATLKEMGEVLELGFPDDSNRYDGNNPCPHVHLVCVKCRDISDPEDIHQKAVGGRRHRPLSFSPLT